jgi:microcystin degradation protein MlrC
MSTSRSARGATRPSTPTPSVPVGAEPADYRVVIVKSAQHFYNGFVGLAKEILYVASPGAADPDVTRWPYTKRRTPFWPKVADPWV